MKMLFHVTKGEYYEFVDKSVERLRKKYYNLINDNTTRKTKKHKRNICNDVQGELSIKVYDKRGKGSERELSVADKKPVEGKASNKRNRSNGKPVLRRQKKK